MPISNQPIATAIEMVREGAELYLGEALLHVEGSKAESIKVNTLLTEAVLQSLMKSHGADLVISISDRKMSSDVILERSSRRSIFILLRDVIKEEVRLPSPQTFTFKSMLIQKAKEVEGMLQNIGDSSLEKKISENLPNLSANREPKKFYSMLVRAIADCLCTLYVDAIETDRTRRDEEEVKRITVLAAACLLKDIGSVTGVKTSMTPREKAKCHPQISTLLVMSDRLDEFSASDLLPDKLVPPRHQADLAQVVRVILDHENLLSKSRLAQVVMRGTALSGWLLEQSMPDVPLSKKDFAAANHFDPIEIDCYLNMAVCVSNDAVREAAKKCAGENNLMRLAMYRRYLSTQGFDFPFETWSELDANFHGFFSQFADYSPANYLFLRNLIAYFNILSKQRLTEKARLEMMKAYGEKLKVILF
ncbi:MAG: hypothetical protein JXR97_02390 [Planctomycetes bacterium]|nr:hypothetical protein [Planctomycetota bacterium]